ncbi:hypothetical protein CO665_03320 [Rhizobium anhuiense]|uniref:NmrA family NAD(P)-binding protein n=1 Tax=Rhizobium anhuiense TaxID=1184720 RepID=UPI000BE7C9BC|nr:NmrA family NAD(P)-binding protein [Rhizobium anhuiense]PDS39425.1 hypothetical protein CO665_03320 [Rhizobium anhuiense]
MSNTRSVLVTGATGQQGGAVVRALIARGHRVKAISRRPDSEGAKRLTAAGVEVVAGDLDDAASVATAAEGVYAAALPPTRVLQQITIDDIGAFVSALAERREQVFGKRFDIAGDELSGEQQVKILSEVLGRPIRFQELPIAAIRQQSEDTALMFEWFDRTGYDAGIAALRRDFPEVGWHSYADWARGFDWSVLGRAGG